MEIDSVDENSIEFFRFVRGVKQSKILMKDQLALQEFVNLVKLGKILSPSFIGDITLHIKSEELVLNLPSNLLKAITKFSKKGFSIKGLSYRQCHLPSKSAKA